MADDQQTDQYSEEETTRRAKEALRRAFATPPEPRKSTGKKGESPAKPPKPHKAKGGKQDRDNRPAKPQEPDAS